MAVVVDGFVYILQNDQLSELNNYNYDSIQNDGKLLKNNIKNLDLIENSEELIVNNEVGSDDNNTTISDLSSFYIDLPMINETNQQVDIQNSQGNLDFISNDFAELVAAFKCKICPYTTQSREDLLPHFQSVHCNSKNVIELKDDNPENEKTTDLASTEMIKLLYMCATCSGCYSTIENCREHMIKDHGLMDAAQSIINNDESSCNSNSDSDSYSNGNSNSNGIAHRQINNEAIETNVTTVNSNVKESQQSKKTNSKLENKKSKKVYADGIQRIVKCSYRGCVYNFSSEKIMLKHAAHHVESTNPNNFKCSICTDMKFTRWKMCSAHLWKEHGIEIDLMECFICKTYKTLSNVKLSDHMKIHSESRDFKCSECGKCFKQANQLRNHRISHLDRKSIKAPRWYTSKTCEICGKTYADSKCLKNHIQAVHSKLKPYICNVCGHTSSKKAMLQLHLRQHTGDKPFSCDMCDFKTGDHNSLRRHVMRHTGIKPYKCPHCPYSAIQSSCLKNHLRSKHPTSTGLFTCELCSFKTVKKKNYIEHISDHSKGLIKTSIDQNQRKKVDEVDEVFEGNIAATQLVYHCLGGYSKKGQIEANLMSSSTSPDGSSQTITIQIPSMQFDGSLPITQNNLKNNNPTVIQEDEETMHCFLKIPHEEEENIDTGGITIPAVPEDSIILNVES